MSWYRCREEYDVDPGLDRAPAAAEVSAHSIEHDVVFAELGGQAASAGGEVEGLDSLVTVADPEGRILAVWGSRRIQHLAAQSNLAPWSTWSEWACGTNGMGTALESHRPVMVRGPEHWCQGFHPWACAGVAVRDVVTDEPLAVLNISCWQRPLPDPVLPWLRRVAAATEAKLRQRAHHSGTLLAAAFADARVPPTTPLAVVDPAGNVVLANSEAAVLIGTPADVPAYAPTQRWTSQIPALPHLAHRVIEHARQDPDWTGSTQVFVPFLNTPIPVVVRPVLTGTQVIGALLSFGSDAEGGPALASADAGDPLASSGPRRGLPKRVVALRDDHWVLLDPREIQVRRSRPQQRLAHQRPGTAAGRRPWPRPPRAATRGKGLPPRPPPVPGQPEPRPGSGTGLQGHAVPRHRHTRPRTRAGRSPTRIAAASGPRLLGRFAAPRQS